MKAKSTGCLLRFLPVRNRSPAYLFRNFTGCANLRGRFFFSSEILASTVLKIGSSSNWRSLLLFPGRGRDRRTPDHLHAVGMQRDVIT